MTLIVKNGALIVDADTCKTMVNRMLEWLENNSCLTSCNYFLNGSVTTYQCCIDGYTNEYIVVKTR